MHAHTHSPITMIQLLQIAIMLTTTIVKNKQNSFVHNNIQTMLKEVDYDWWMVQDSYLQNLTAIVVF